MNVEDSFLKFIKLFNVAFAINKFIAENVLNIYG